AAGDHEARRRTCLGRRHEAGPRLVERLPRARDASGARRAPRLITGNVALCEELEHALASLHGATGARLFNSGYAANTGVIPILAEKGDVVFSDELNHASIIDGCRLSRAQIVVYRHNDLEHLSELLAAHPGRRRLVVTESIFSMDGDLSPLGTLRELTAAAGAILMVDDAHAVGAVGDGRGLGWSAGADVVIGTLGKAFGAAGAYVLGTAALVDVLWNRARSLVFSTGLPVPALAAGLAAVRLVSSEEGTTLRERLERHRRTIDSASHIVPFVVGDDRRAVAAMNRLMEAGLLVQAIRPPTVPVGTSRLRLSLSAALTDADLGQIMGALDALEAEGWFVPRGTSR
ncbi:MAG: aminotransferase class I/II-fold pyridoxal phosphate-dependent enzyme, partial [Deltaproteobacteria bacterium]|nr:aminotransferase class I/II-fold pyridoxal phosphate-dependent enzyme [Kofleriaceae bacterium]